MKQWLIIIALLLVLLIAGFVVTWRIAAPKAVQSFVPAKWQNIPLGEKRSFIHEYLGEPLSAGNRGDHWEERLASAKKYILDIGYREDSVAIKYQVVYEVRVLGFVQSTDVAADSLK